MARVPTADGFQVGLRGMPTQQVVAPEMSDAPGRQLQAWGGAMQKFGGAMGEIAARMQAQADEVVVTDALNRHKERALTLQHDKDAGYLAVKGKKALEREDGRSLTEAYGEQLDNSLRDLAGGLANDRQRAAFIKAAGNINVNFRGGVQAHELREFQGYQLSTAEGVIATSQREVALNWRDADAVQGSILRIEGAVYRQAQLLGKSAEWQEAAVRKLTSDAHRSAALQAIEAGELEFASQYLNRHGKGMDAGDIVAVRGHLVQARDAVVGSAVASDHVTTAAPRMVAAGGDLDRAFNILLGTESGHRQFGENGKPLTSSDGAVGIAQVMPGTGPVAARLAGMPWDEKRYRTDPAYNRALGMAYFGQRVKDFGGDLAKAYAAYNAGARWVKEAEQRAAKAEPGTQQADWFWQLNNDRRSPANRKQTENYVAKNMREFEAGAGRAAKPALDDVLAGVRSDPRVAGSQQRTKLAVEEATRQFRAQEAGNKQRAEEANAAVLQSLIANGGNWGAVPVGLRMRLSEAAPDKVDNAMRFGQALAKGREPQTDWGLFYELSSDPATLRSVNLMAVRDKLSDTEFKQLMTMQQSAGKDQNLTALQTPMALVTQFAREAGINTTGKNKRDAEKLGRITADVQANITAAEQEKGKKLTADEMRAVVAQSFVKVQVDRPYWFNTEKPAALLDPDDRLVIPDAERTQIVDALKRNGRPTDEQTIQALYRQHKGL